MMIKCIENNINNFSENEKLFSYLKKSVHLEDGILPITVNRQYTVYSIKYDIDGLIKYLICNDDFTILEYPIFYISNFFEVVDDRASAFWINTLNTDRRYHVGQTEMVTFKEWHDSNVFYENLVNGSDFEVDIFLKYKELMDKEF